MLARRALLTALLLAIVLPAAAIADLRIYSSLPLQGDNGPQSRDVVRGMKLALADRSSKAGGQAIEYVSLDDSIRAAGQWESIQVAANARRAADDRDTIAYLGEFNSGASAISIPILNEAGILQISPSNTYTGLTRSDGAQRGEPDKYYPTGTRTYGRVSAADHLQAAAIVTYMKAVRVKRLFIANDREVYGKGIADLVRARASAVGIRVLANAGVDGYGSDSPGLRSIARRAGRSSADAFFYGGITQNGAIELWRQVHRADRKLKLFAPDGVAQALFTEKIPAAAAKRTYITDPPIDPSFYPAAGQTFLARFRDTYHRAPEPYAIYGYEAMALALDAIDRSGAASASEAGRRAAVDAFFATRDRDSVLGRYSIDANGDTTLSTYGGYRVKGKRLVFDRVLDSALNPPAASSTGRAAGP